MALGGVVVLPAGGAPPGWALALDRATPDAAERELAAAGCALLDGSRPDALALARRLHAADPTVQLVIVATGAERAAIERAMLFTPGLGEVWFSAPEGVGEELIERAAGVTRQRRSYRRTRARIEHDLSAIEPHAARRAFISDAYLSALLAVLPDPVLSVDDEGHVLSWNAAAERVLGRSREEAIGRPLLDVLAPAEGGALDRALAAPGAPALVEIRYRRGSGEEGVAEVALAPVETAGARVRAVLLHDLTEERRAQAELEAQASELEAQTEELQTQAAHLEETQAETQRAREDAENARATLDAFFQAVPVAAAVVDRDLRYRRMNRTLGAIDGIDPDEAVGRTIHQVVPDLAPSLEPLYRRVLESGEPIEKLEITRTDPDGSGRPTHFLVSYFPIEVRGERQGVGLLALDVTEQRAAEEARRDEALIVETLHRIGQSVASELDVERIVQDVTDAATSLTGAQFGAFFYNVASEEGESYTLYTISGVDREAFARFPMPRATEVFAPTFHGTAVVRSDDITADPRYGTMAPHFGMPEGHLPVRSYLAVPVTSNTGEVLGGLFFGHPEPGRFEERHERLAVGIAGWAAVAMDNARLYKTELRARAEAERANRVKSEFLATMSHELRTPLNAMIGYADLLLAGIPEPVPEAARQKVERIGVSARHLLALIEEILTFSRLEAGEERIDLEELDARTLVHEVQALVEPLALTKGIRYACEVPPEPVAMVSDARKIRQILINLTGNAAKFTERGEVRVSLAAVGDEVVFQVSDTGPGIEAEDLERIFEPFWQVVGGTTRTAGGTGLGLSVTRRLARLLGGEVGVETVVGEGSVFTVRLPSRARPRPDPDPD